MALNGLKNKKQKNECSYFLGGVCGLLKAPTEIE